MRFREEQMSMTFQPLALSPDPISSEKPNRTVVVFGAAGHTGRFVVSELLRRGLTPILSGRDAAKLKAVVEVPCGGGRTQRKRGAPRHSAWTRHLCDHST